MNRDVPTSSSGVLCSDTSTVGNASKLIKADTPNETPPQNADDLQYKKFTLFMKLPPELRMIICELALEVVMPRMPEAIHLYPSSARRKVSGIYAGKVQSFYRSRNLTTGHVMIIAMLQVSLELRHAIWKNYCMLTGPLSRPLLLRPSVDCLDFRDMHHLNDYVKKASSTSRSGNAQKVQQLSIGSHPIRQRHDFSLRGNASSQDASPNPVEELCQAILLFPNLKRIFFYFDVTEGFRMSGEIWHGLPDRHETFPLADRLRQNAIFKECCARYLQTRSNLHPAKQHKGISRDSHSQVPSPRMPELVYTSRKNFNETHHVRPPPNYRSNEGLQVMDSRWSKDGWFW
ncbi:hypothetical protein MFRU_016g00740 [Monilinia fructicola]|nr:hypothetical protein MFRU_016g00740 [Monilinia fructicola]